MCAFLPLTILPISLFRNDKINLYSENQNTGYIFKSQENKIRYTS